ncbi:hypothetical protein [Enterobacter sp. R1(2018)]|uniref:hypothetical protein n=1 Tax=Enterobacter sp. R1(2018) TaxID=2447891 RepID=UPI000EB218DE|nr:hypothetical protein [Enterobacter sp. R1(2018)]RKQ38371.1 hypothetical protein D8M09_17350 [Enterobacter sp. R1(2018)]
MKIIKLSQKAIIFTPSNSVTGGETKTTYEEVYINAERIESFSWYGMTQLKMASGERIEVCETPEEIIALLETSS